jgi:HK97 family phage major capsid protein
MQSIQALREQISARAKEVRTLVESNNASWSPDHQAKYDAGMAEIEDLKSQVSRAEQVLAAVADDKQIEAATQAVASRAPDAKTGDKIAAIYDKFLRGGEKAVSADEWRDIRAVMSTTTGSEGGFTVQPEVARRVIDALKAFGGVRSAATVIVTSNGADMNFPTSDGTAEVGEIIAQNVTATAQDPVFGTVGLPVYKFSSKIVAVPFELLQDSQIDVAAFVENRLVQRIGRSTNAFFTTGTGTNQPAGIVPRSTVGFTAANGTTQVSAITFDSLLSLVHSVDPAYRQAPGVGFMMNDNSLLKVRQIKDTQNRPVFIPGYDGLGGALGDTIMGYRVTVNQDMANMAANARSILFGDLRQYHVRDAMAVTMFRFEDSNYARLGQIGFLAWHRSGGNLLDTAAVKAFVNAAS